MTKLCGKKGKLQHKYEFCINMQKTKAQEIKHTLTTMKSVRVRVYLVGSPLFFLLQHRLNIARVGRHA